MNQIEKMEAVNKIIKKCLDTLDIKNKEYSSDNDVLSNFKESKEFGLTQFQSWAIFFNKHKSSIYNAIKNNPENPDTNSSEDLESRIIDCINYLLLLYCLKEEKALHVIQKYEKKRNTKK